MEIIFRYRKLQIRIEGGSDENGDFFKDFELDEIEAILECKDKAV